MNAQPEIPQGKSKEELNIFVLSNCYRKRLKNPLHTRNSF